jgi:hypothetical protein
MMWQLMMWIPYMSREWIVVGHTNIVIEDSKVLLLYNRSIPKETSNTAQMLDLGIDGPNMAKDHDIIL